MAGEPQEDPVSTSQLFTRDGKDARTNQHLTSTQNRKRPRHGSPPSVALTFDPDTHIALRRRSHAPLVGLPIGTLPSNPQQNTQLGAPFAFTADQCKLVRDSTILPPSLVTPNSREGSQQEKDDPLDQKGNDDADEKDLAPGSATFRVLQDLVERGYFVVSGMQHGFDLVAYEGDPVRHHGSNLVKVVDADETIAPRELVLWHRLATSAHKSAILAVADQGDDASPPRYYCISGIER